MYVYMYVCMHALPPADDRRAEGVGFNPCVCGQLCCCCLSAGIPAQGSAASAVASFLPSVTFGGREDVAESCNSRSKHTAALKIRAKAFLYKHMVLFILLISLSNAYLPLQSTFQPQGKQASRWKGSWASDWSGSQLWKMGDLDFYSWLCSGSLSSRSL